jgi:hypothetical protein
MNRILEPLQLKIERQLAQSQDSPIPSPNGTVRGWPESTSQFSMDIGEETAHGRRRSCS